MIPHWLRATTWAVLGLTCVSLCWGDTPAPTPVDHVQGNWLGEWALDGGGGGKQTAQIISLGNGEYQAVFTAYDGSEQESETFRFLINGTLVEKKGVFSAQINLGENLGMFELSADVENDLLLGKFSNKKNYIGTLKLKRVELKPEGLAAKPLPGAAVLFDGTSLDAWKLPDSMPEAWKIQEGTLHVTAPPPGADPAQQRRHLAAREPMGASQIHVEYRTPLMPEARGERRGNSGIFLQGRYEIQLVDSFGQPRQRDNFGELADNDSAGAIYKYAAPLENVTLPPGEWQTLDITFTPPVLDAEGKVEKSAEITVLHNGTLIHDRTKVHKPTEGAPIRDFTTPAGLVLEDAGQPVEFRNIWQLSLEPAK